MAGGCLGLAIGVGCAAETRTSNQGGGNIFTATAKLQSGNIGDLTPDELQILGDTASQYAGVAFPALTDDQAQLVVDFLVLNGIGSIAQLTAVLQSGSVEVPQELIDLFNSVTGSAIG
jgi:hypothetical protein